MAAGGVADHVHVLVGIKATHAVGDLVREAKKAATERMGQEACAAPTVGSTETVVA